MCTSFYGNVSMLSSSPHTETWSCRWHPKLMAGLHSLCHALPKLAAVEAKLVLNTNGLIWTLHDLTVACFVGFCRFIQNVLLSLSCCILHVKGILHVWSEMSMMSQSMSNHLNAPVTCKLLSRNLKVLKVPTEWEVKIELIHGAKVQAERECSGVHPSCLTK